MHIKSFIALNLSPCLRTVVKDFKHSNLHNYNIQTLHAILAKVLKSEMRTVLNYFKLNKNFILIVQIRKSKAYI